MRRGFETCSCLTAAPSDRVETWLGVDKTDGRFAECRLLRCERCAGLWLHYFVEYEAFTSSGRWAMGLILQAHADAMTPELAAAYLDGLPWVLIGGSYWGGSVKRSRGPLYWGIA